jgi:sulfotransferase
MEPSMQNGIHFISGLPRSGSTLLSALLRQNPRFWAGMTSPVGSLFNAMLRETSQRNEASVFIDDALRQRLLRAMFEAYYADIHPQKVVFDTNRMWTTKLPALTQLFPDAKIICCVRNPAWVVDSIEALIRRNAFELSGIFNYEPGGTVYARVEGLGSGTGMVGFAYNALREAVYSEFGDRLLLVRYESLTANPIGTLTAIYNFIGEKPFGHDPNHIEPCYDMIEFDRRLGTPGLHEVGGKVQARTRHTVLPPDLFSRFDNDAFWNDPVRLPHNVPVV